MVHGEWKFALIFLYFSTFVTFLRIFPYNPSAFLCQRTIIISQLTPSWIMIWIVIPNCVGTTLGRIYKIWMILAAGRNLIVYTFCPAFIKWCVCPTITFEIWWSCVDWVTRTFFSSILIIRSWKPWKIFCNIFVIRNWKYEIELEYRICWEALKWNWKIF